MSTKYTVIRLTHGGEKFEILVDPDRALAYKQGRKQELSKLLVVDEVFTDARRGERASADRLRTTFGTSDPLKAAEMILEQGKLQLTSEQRQEMVEQKKKQIVYLISRNYADPRTKLPHPPSRIEQALEQVHLPIDPFEDAEEQVKKFAKALLPILPLSMEKIVLALRIPHQYANKAYGSVKNMAEVQKQEWQPDGSWIAIVEIAAGLRVDFMDKIGKATGGSAEVKILD